MNKTMRFSVLALCLAVAGAQGYSNPVEGGSTQTVSNQWNVAAPWLMVGGNTEGNALVVDGGQVNNQIGYIGNAVSASNNSATVTGAGSTWNNASELSVGKEGSGNTLAVVGGGLVDAATAYVGNNSGGNFATVDGSGSQLNAATLHVGHLGSGNSLDISNGGKTTTANGTIGYWIGADNNTATVQGSNSLWQSSASINVGDYGSGNQLSIADAGRVENPVVNLGVQSASSNNALSVAGSGAYLDAPEIHIGGSSAGAGGTGNRIEVSNGGTVATTNLNIYVGNRFDLNAGGTLAVDGDFSASTPGFNFNSGGILEVGGELTGMGSKIENQRSIVMNGSEAFWDQSGSNLYVGMNTDGNGLAVKNGGRAEDRIGYMGYAAGADSNSVLVTGTGSVWQNTEALYLGGQKSGDNWVDGGTGNSLTVSNGGWVQVGDIGINNLPNPGNLGVVSVGGINGAEMVVANKSMASADKLVLGYRADEVGSVQIRGASEMNLGTQSLQISSENSVTVGRESSGNQLEISQGGVLQSRGGTIGEIAGANANRVTVTGAESKWLNYYGFPTTICSMDYPSSVCSTSYNELMYFGLGGSSNRLEVLDGGLVSSTEGVVGSQSTANKNRVEVRGSNAVWQTTYHLVLGDNGSGNQLRIGADGQVYAGSFYLGRGNSGNSNLVVVAGEHALLSVGELPVPVDSNSIPLPADSTLLDSEGQDPFYADMGDLRLGYGGRGNALVVSNGGLVSVSRNMHNRNYSTVNIETGGHIAIASNYYQDATSILRFGVETNAVGAPLNPFVSVGGTAEFETGATLQYHSNVGLLDFDTFYTNLVVEANQLIVGGVTNATALDLEAINLDGSLVDVMLWEADQNIFGLVGRKHLADSAGFEAGSKMAQVSKEIDDLSLMGNPLAVEQINRLNGMSAARQNAQLTQRYNQGTPTYRHRQAMQGGMKQVLAQTHAFQAGNRSAGEAPAGPAGPHRAGQGLRGWVRGYGAWANHDGSDSFSGFDQDVYGTVMGLDRAFGNILLGAAGGYARSDLTQDNHDSSDAKTGFGLLYASFGSTDWFGDLNLGYGRSDIKTHSGTALGGEGDFDANLYSIYFGIGKEMRLADGGLLLTPEAAMNIGYYDQEKYADGLMKVDAYDRWNYQSRIGAALALEKQTDSIRWKPEVRAYWLHEFDADPDRLGYALGGGHYTFGVQAPDEDLLDAGIGLTATVRERLEFVLDLDGQYSGRYQSLVVGARLAYEF